MAVQVIIAFLIILFILTLIAGFNKNRKQWTILGWHGISKEDMIHVGTYIGGHPNIYTSKFRAVIYKFEKDLIIAEQFSPRTPPERKAFILGSSVKNVQVENSIFDGDHIIPERPLMVDINSHILPHEKKTELQFVIINWEDGQSVYSTIFSFDGKNAIQKANAARNAIVKAIGKHLFIV